LPLLIHEAQSLHEPQAAGGAVPAHSEHVEEQVAEGMQFAVVCSEDAPRWDQENITEERSPELTSGTAFMSGMRAACSEWPRGPWTQTSASPLQSDVPTLVLSGTDDP
jgi:hypothetical protein